MIGMELYFAQVAHAAIAATKRIELGRALTAEEDGAIWAEVSADVKRARPIGDLEAIKATVSRMPSVDDVGMMLAKSILIVCAALGVILILINA